MPSFSASSRTFGLRWAAVTLALLVLVPAPIARAQAPGRGHTEWVVTALPIGIGVSRVVVGPVSVGLALTGPGLALSLGDDGGDENRLASAAVPIDVATGRVVWRLAPAAIVVSGNDWSQVYPGFHAGARTRARVGGLDLALGVDLAGARLAGPNGTGTWRAWLGPVVGIAW